MRIRNLLLLFIMVFLLSGCGQKCTINVLNTYFEKTDSLLVEFNGNIGYGFNHPSLISKLAHEMIGMRADYRIMVTPRCAKRYKSLVLDAMESSIRMFTNEEERYYTQSELAEISYEKWRVAEIERNHLLKKYRLLLRKTAICFV